MFYWLLLAAAGYLGWKWWQQRGAADGGWMPLDAKFTTTLALDPTFIDTQLQTDLKPYVAFAIRRGAAPTKPAGVGGGEVLIQGKVTEIAFVEDKSAPSGTKRAYKVLIMKTTNSPADAPRIGSFFVVNDDDLLAIVPTEDALKSAVDKGFSAAGL